MPLLPLIAALAVQAPVRQLDLPIAGDLQRVAGEAFFGDNEGSFNPFQFRKETFRRYVLRRAEAADLGFGDGPRPGTGGAEYTIVFEYALYDVEEVSPVESVGDRNRAARARLEALAARSAPLSRLDLKSPSGRSLLVKLGIAFRIVVDADLGTARPGDRRFAALDIGGTSYRVARHSARYESVGIHTPPLTAAAPVGALWDPKDDAKLDPKVDPKEGAKLGDSAALFTGVLQALQRSVDTDGNIQGGSCRREVLGFVGETSR